MMENIPPVYLKRWIDKKQNNELLSEWPSSLLTGKQRVTNEEVKAYLVSSSVIFSSLIFRLCWSLQFASVASSNLQKETHT